MPHYILGEILEEIPGKFSTESTREISGRNIGRISGESGIQLKKSLESFRKNSKKKILKADSIGIPVKNLKKSTYTFWKNV